MANESKGNTNEWGTIKSRKSTISRLNGIKRRAKPSERMPTNDETIVMLVDYFEASGKPEEIFSSRKSPAEERLIRAILSFKRQADPLTREFVLSRISDLKRAIDEVEAERSSERGKRKRNSG